MRVPDDRPERAAGDRAHELQKLSPQCSSKLKSAAQHFGNPQPFEPGCNGPGAQIVHGLDLLVDNLSGRRPVRRIHKIKRDATADQANDMSVCISHGSF